MTILAIDQGTTSTRALALEPDGSFRIAHTVEHAQHYPQQGWVEHDPEELIRNIRACIAAVPDATAIGIDNQGESCLAWDTETKQALSPVIVWQDDRTAATVGRLKDDGFEVDTLAITGLPLDPYFSASKLAWIIETLPAAREALGRGTLRLGTTDAFFMDRLTGRCVTDVTTASRTSLMALDTLDWDATLCARFGVPLETLPAIVPTTGDFGAIEVGGRTIPVRASLTDQQAALYGHGCRARGDAKVTFGTGAFALMITGNTILRAPDKGLLPTVAWQKAGESPVYALDGGVYAASAAVNWAKGLGLFTDFAEINGFDAPSALSRGLVFIPALSGLACPHWDRSARGTWLGLSLEHGPADLVQAVLEGVALRAAEVLDAMGMGPDVALSIDGGMSTNPYFCQFLADGLRRPVHVPDGGERTALGTALLAAEASGQTIEPHGDMTRYAPAPEAVVDTQTFGKAVRLCREWKA